ncbi:hypothetical protein BDY21DRAFT_210506 [Lineolata rhizophorae]|uniref:Uncharacterized protein n=1 Tax=Lineolata rhizophorae TaxID=578093 RepID=A0A6A6P4K3_9PEZI|nr:hypothetical protein BDY21DRAFT_210506 [Lineolata rhizophorae]
MLNPQITVTDPEYGSGPRSLPGSSAPSPAPRGRSHRGHSAGPSRWNKFLARFRLVLICVSVVASGAILGCNAVILATYNAHKDAGRWMDRASSDERVWWSAWPEEGVDLVPIDAYLGLAAVSVIVMAAFLISSSHTSFRYLSAGVCRTLIVAIVVGVLLVAWVLLSVFLQFEAIGSSGKHSFRTWACSHEDQDLYKMDGFQFTSLCTEANFSRYGGLVNCAVCGLIFFTILLSCGANRRSRSYQRIERSNNAWMPKWGRSN